MRWEPGRRAVGFGASLLLGVAVAVTSSGEARPSSQAVTGTIEGRIAFAGPTPPATIVIEGGTTQEVLYVDRSGGLRFAVVVVSGIPPGLPGTAPRASTDARVAGTGPIVNQRNYVFEPQVLAVRAGQVVRFTSDDPANHNVRTRAARAADVFSVTTTGGEPPAHRFGATPADDPVELSCDIHPWMAAWIYAFDHPHFAVTGPSGTFQIADVPPGRHRVAVRQPAGGLSRDELVTVEPGGVVRLDVTFRPADMRLPPR